MSQQGLRQASVRAVTGSASTYEGDWHALFDAAGIPAGAYNGRLLSYINLKLSAAHTNLSGAMAALAAANGATSFAGLGTFNASVGPFPQSILAGLFSDADVYFGATVVGGSFPQGITGGLFTDADTFYAATVAQPGAAQNMTGDFFDDSADTFYSATVTVGGTQTITGSLFTDADTFYGATVAGSGGGGVTSITHQSDAGNSSGSAITAPSDIQAGDVLIYYDFGTNISGAPTSVTPSGFTLANSASISTRRANVSFKKATGAEASAAITGMNADSSNEKILVVFRPNVPATTLTLSSTVGSQATNSDPTPQTVAASGGVAPLIVIGAAGSNGVINPRTMTVGGSPAKDGEYTFTNGSFVWWKIYNSSPADVVIDMDDEGTNLLQSFYLQVA